MSKNHQFTQVPIETLKPGDIVLFHSHGVLAKGIQLMCKSYWNHTALITRVFLDDNVGIVENNKFGIHSNLLSYYDKNDKIILRPKEYLEYKGIKAFQSTYYLNVKQNNWYQIIKFLIQCKFKKTKSRLPCIEMVGKAWENSDVNLFNLTLQNMTQKLIKIWGPDKV